MISLPDAVLCLVSLSVCLENNSFGDKEAHLFASALRSNYYLRELNLQKNSIGARGKASLMRALRDTSSLNAIADANYACRW